MSDNDTGRYTTHGFTWGPMEVTRIAYIEGSGRALKVRTGSRELEVWVSEKGRSVRCWLDGKLMEATDE